MHSPRPQPSVSAWLAAQTHMPMPLVRALLTCPRQTPMGPLTAHTLLRVYAHVMVGTADFLPRADRRFDRALQVLRRANLIQFVDGHWIPGAASKASADLVAQEDLEASCADALNREAF